MWKEGVVAYFKMYRYSFRNATKNLGRNNRYTGRAWTSDPAKSLLLSMLDEMVKYLSNLEQAKSSYPRLLTNLLGHQSSLCCSTPLHAEQEAFSFTALQFLIQHLIWSTQHSVIFVSSFSLKLFVAHFPLRNETGAYEIASLSVFLSPLA